ncbi:hypothetical protein C8R45DRAFT_868593 [Mycena sanguinolenta]|nr:hypothetical protein C8R45DRAFT_868593 [Mycena sanguinolenta]
MAATLYGAVGDSDVLEAIQNALASDPPNYGLVVWPCCSKLERDGLDTLAGIASSNWTSIKASIQNNLDDPRVSAFTGALKHSLELQHCQPVIKFLTHIMPSPPLPLPPPPPPTFAVVQQTLKALLASDSLHQQMTLFVTGKKQLPIWQPKKNGPYKSFLADLRIPVDMAEGKPDMLLYELGRLGREDQEYAERLDELFQPGTSLTNKFVANTSGAGKTRLMAEGLCQHWGIYFTAQTERNIGHGSRDMQIIIDETIPTTNGFNGSLSDLDAGSGFETQLKNNVAIAQHHFRCLLLARLHVLSAFLEIVHSVPREIREPEENYRTRWLTLQLKPSILGVEFDIFHELTETLTNGLSGSNSDQLPLVKVIHKAIKDQLSAIYKLCDAPKMNGNNFLYLIVDEVQYAADNLWDAFRADKSSSDVAVDARKDPRKPRPVLREIIIAWLTIGKPLVIVAAGTGVNREVVDETMHSAVLKNGQYTQFYGTGSFGSDATGSSRQEKYIRRFIPPDDIIQPQDVEREIFPALIGKIIYWLKGRFRFTTAFISDLLADELQQPHKTLNNYIYQLTFPRDLRRRPLLSQDYSGLKVTDGARYIKNWEDTHLKTSNRTFFNFDKLAEPSHTNVMATIRNMVMRYWLSSNGDLSNLTISETEFVQYGFARFLPETTQKNIEMARIDEPLALLALAHWFNAFGESLHHKLALSVGQNSASGENALENYLAFCFSGLFSDTRGSRRLDEIFTFAKPAPAWAKQRATLVSLHSDTTSKSKKPEVSRVDWWSRPSYSLATHPSQDASVTLDWLQHKLRVPICFPAQKMGPDLLFILQLESGKMIWVAVQSKYASSTLLDTESLKKALRSVTPAKYFSSQPKNKRLAHKFLSKLPNRQKEDAGAYSLLRVVASFPGETAITEQSRRQTGTLANMRFWDDVDGEHPLASLNILYLADITKGMAPENYLTGIRNAPRPRECGEEDEDEGFKEDEQVEIEVEIEEDDDEEDDEGEDDDEEEIEEDEGDEEDDDDDEVGDAKDGKDQENADMEDEGDEENTSQQQATRRRSTRPAAQKARMSFQRFASRSPERKRSRNGRQKQAAEAKGRKPAVINSEDEEDEESSTPPPPKKRRGGPGIVPPSQIASSSGTNPYHSSPPFSGTGYHTPTPFTASAPATPASAYPFPPDTPGPLEENAADVNMSDAE